MRCGPIILQWLNYDKVSNIFLFKVKGIIWFVYGGNFHIVFKNKLVSYIYAIFIIIIIIIIVVLKLPFELVQKRSLLVTMTLRGFRVTRHLPQWKLKEIKGGKMASTLWVFRLFKKILPLNSVYMRKRKREYYFGDQNIRIRWQRR